MATTAAAPVATAREVTVQASPDVVWATLTEVDRWPAWNPDVAWVRSDGPVAPGMTFRWKSGPGTIRSTIRELEPLRRLDERLAHLRAEAERRSAALGPSPVGSVGLAGGPGPEIGR